MPGENYTVSRVERTYGSASPLALSPCLLIESVNHKLLLMSKPSFRYLMSGKIHGATVTDSNVEYEGSITVDGELLEGAGIAEYEQVQVLSLDSGARLTTYVITAERGSGVVCINGAAARLISKGERVIIITYGLVAEADVADHVPNVVRVDRRNRRIADAPLASGTLKN